MLDDHPGSTCFPRRRRVVGMRRESQLYIIEHNDPNCSRVVSSRDALGTCPNMSGACPDMSGACSGMRRNGAQPRHVPRISDWSTGRDQSERRARTPGLYKTVPELACHLKSCSWIFIVTSVYIRICRHAIKRSRCPSVPVVLCVQSRVAEPDNPNNPSSNSSSTRLNPGMP